MTTVRIFEHNGMYQGYEADGHSGFAEAGEDIVCAAISVLTVNTANAIETLTDDPVEASEDDGYLVCRFPEGLSEQGALLMDSMILGLKSIESSYGKSFINVNTEEV